MTKAELIERYGEQWYEDFKTRQREEIRQRYHNDIEASRERCRANYHKHRASYKNTPMTDESSITLTQETG